MKTYILLLFLALSGVLGCSYEGKDPNPPCCCCPGPIRVVPENATRINNLDKIIWETNGGRGLHFELRKETNNYEANVPSTPFLATVTEVDSQRFSQPIVLRLCTQKESLDYKNPDFNLCRYLEWLFAGELYYLKKVPENQPDLPESWTTVVLEKSDQTKEEIVEHKSGAPQEHLSIYTEYNTSDVLDLLSRKVLKEITSIFECSVQ